MKNKLLLIAFMLIIGVSELFSQSFKYDDLGKSLVHIKPAFEEYSVKGKKSFLVSFSQEYYKDIFREVSNECLTASQKDILKGRGLILWLWVNGKGEVYYAELLLKKRLRPLIDEKELLTIYNAVRKVKFDMSKGYIASSETLTENHTMRMSCVLVP